MLDHREPQRDELCVRNGREPLRHAHHEAIATGVGRGGEQLDAQPVHPLRLVERARVGQRRRSERGEERGRDEHEREEPALEPDAAQKARARRDTAAQARTPDQQVQRAERHEHEEQEDLGEKRDAVRGLVQILEQHQAGEGLQRAGRDERRDAGQRDEREAPGHIA